MLAPPYDVITPEDQRRYYAQDPLNVVRLIAGEVYSSDDAADNKYTRAAGFFRQWLNSGILRREPDPCFYLYRQAFRVPETGQRLQRTGILAVTALEPFGSAILAHERTHARPKADRLSLTRAVNANLSPVFALYAGAGQSLQELVREGVQTTPRFSLLFEGEEENVVWVVRHPRAFKVLKESFTSARLYIADGHHRYETALNYRNAQRVAHPDAPADAAFNFVLMLLVDADDPSLVILPTHRVLYNLDTFKSDSFESAVEARYPVRRLGSPSELRSLTSQNQADSEVAILLRNRQPLVVTLPSANSADPVARLNVSRFHRLILGDLLNVHDETERHLGYSRDARWIINEVESGRAQAGFLLQAPTVKDVLAVAGACETMPEKSTYFYPKPLSGIVFNPLDANIRVPPA